MDTNYVKSTGKWDKATPILLLNNCAIGKELTEQLLTGVVDEKRYINYDKYWSEKLAHLDSAHTSEYNLNIDQIDESLINILQYLNNKNEKRIAVSCDRLVDCFKILKPGGIFMCNDEVQKFIESVHKFMFKVVRPDLRDDTL